MRAYERAGRGLGETDADPVVAAEEGGTRENSQHRGVRPAGVILPLQSVSWIDPASRPATPSLTYNSQAARVSTWPASFAATPANATEHDGLVAEPTGLSQAEESMAEFIMRIESEAEAGMPVSRPANAGFFEDEEIISVDMDDGQQVHYEASETQTPNVLGEDWWDPDMMHARESEAYIGDVTEPYIGGWEDRSDEPDLSFTWDPNQYRRY